MRWKMRNACPYFSQFGRRFAVIEAAAGRNEAGFPSAALSCHFCRHNGNRAKLNARIIALEGAKTQNKGGADV